MNNRKQSGFTLIEMLGVLTVMAILMAVTMSAFRGIGKTAKIDSALNQLTSTLRLSRQLAITKTAPVAVVFPSYAQSTNYGLQAYAVFQSGDQVSEWKFMPKGIYIDDSQSLTGNVFKVSLLVGTNFPGLPVDNYAMLHFKPNGTVDGMYPRVWIVEAIQNPDGTLIPLRQVGSETNCISINNLTGTSRIIR